MSGCGTYEHCSNCRLNPNCCADFGEIDAPVLSKKEVEKLELINKLSDFYKKVNDDVYTLKIEGTQCTFFQNGKCSIYENRPLDCRLFPFDLKKIDDKYYLILYEFDCIDADQFSKNVDSVDPIVDELISWIDSYADASLTEKLDNIPYKIIKEIRKEVIG